jgi:hypothetical protein
MRAAVVGTRGLENDDELSARLAAAMRHSKQQEGSGYVVWRPDLA